MKNKKYLIALKSEKLYINISVNSDNLKPFIVHYNGSQYGSNYSTVGKCARVLKNIIEKRPDFIPVYGTINDLPVTGSNI